MPKDALGHGSNPRGGSSAKPSGKGRKRGPQTAAHPNPGQRVAFALRNKMAHDSGRDARMAAHQAGVRAATSGMSSAGAALLGTLLGAGGAILHGMGMQRGNRR